MRTGNILGRIWNNRTKRHENLQGEALASIKYEQPEDAEQRDQAVVEARKYRVKRFVNNEIPAEADPDFRHRTVKYL